MPFLIYQVRLTSFLGDGGLEKDSSAPNTDQLRVALAGS